MHLQESIPYLSNCHRPDFCGYASFFVQKQSDRCACGVLALLLRKNRVIAAHVVCSHLRCSHFFMCLSTKCARSTHFVDKHIKKCEHRRCEHTTCAAITLFLRKRSASTPHAQRSLCFCTKKEAYPQKSGRWQFERYGMLSCKCMFQSRQRRKDTLYVSNYFF